MRMRVGQRRTDAARTTKRHYITRAAVDQHGATEGCRGCTGESKRHSARCATRFDEIFAKFEYRGERDVLLEEA